MLVVNNLTTAFYTTILRTNLHIIGCTGIPARYGGFETFAEQISKLLIDFANITVYCDRRFYRKNERSKSWNLVNREFLLLPANGGFSIFYDLLCILRGLKTADSILILGVGAGMWMPFIAPFRKTQIVTHLDGAEWLRPKWNLITRKFLHCSAKLSIRFSDHIILDNSVLLDTVPLKHQHKILNIKYGGNHLPEISEINPVHNKPYALVICRAEPENNLKLIVKAFEEIHHLDLIVISNWNQTRFGRQLKKTTRNNQKVLFKDPIYNKPELLQQYRKQCKIYIHGHSAGGTNPSLIEAMYAGCPILAFDNVFNRNTTKNLAYFFKSSAELIKQINKLSTLDLKKSGEQMREYAKIHYNWSKVIQPLKALL